MSGQQCNCTNTYQYQATLGPICVICGETWEPPHPNEMETDDIISEQTKLIQNYDLFEKATVTERERYSALEDELDIRNI